MGLSRRGSRKGWMRPAALAMPAVLFLAGGALYLSGGSSSHTVGQIRIGSKNFTEQLILGELMAQLIETRTELTVVRRFNLGGTMICHGALASGEIDLYPEYTGTALTTVLELPAASGPRQVYDTVAAAYRERFAAEWLDPFGFDNTYAVSVRDSENYESISELIPAAPGLRAGFTAEFSEREDGYPGLRRA